MFPPPTIYHKLTRYCAYQDRCAGEIEAKLKEWNVSAKDTKKLVGQLKADGFLNELRFARTFVRGKFRVNKWGRVRISYELKRKGIPGNLISEALNEIDDKEYEETIIRLIRQKKTSVNPEKIVNIREKIITFVVGKGFETEWILRVLNEQHIENGY